MTDKNQKYEEEENKIANTISKIKHRIAVFSGKGGVGKTTVSVNAAFGLALEGYKTAILDADITGPNVAKMMDCNDELILLNEEIIPYEKYGVKMISVAGLIKPGEAVIWRGPLRSKLIRQFLADVDWGELDFLIADLPPGTGDEILTIAHDMKPTAALIVTTPQEVSLIDAERAVSMAKQLKIPLIAVVENMSTFICPHCGNASELFGYGGGMKLADRYEIELFGSIPIDIETRISGDSGKPIIVKNPASPVSSAFKEIVKNILQHCTDLEVKEG